MRRVHVILEKDLVTYKSTLQKCCLNLVFEFFYKNKEKKIPVPLSNCEYGETYICYSEMNEHR